MDTLLDVALEGGPHDGARHRVPADPHGRPPAEVTFTVLHVPAGHHLPDCGLLPLHQQVYRVEPTSGPTWRARWAGTRVPPAADVAVPAQR